MMCTCGHTKDYHDIGGRCMAINLLDEAEVCECNHFIEYRHQESW